MPPLPSDFRSDLYYRRAPNTQSTRSLSLSGHLTRALPLSRVQLLLLLRFASHSGENVLRPTSFIFFLVKILLTFFPCSGKLYASGVWERNCRMRWVLATLSKSCEFTLSVGIELLDMSTIRWLARMVWTGSQGLWRLFFSSWWGK